MNSQRQKDASRSVRSVRVQSLHEKFAIVVLAPLLAVLAACSGEVDAPEAATEPPAAELNVVRDWIDDTGTEVPSQTASSVHELPPVEDMIAGLEERLEESPNDVKGWSLLAQSYAHVGRMSDSRAAVDRAVELGADRADLEARVHRAHLGPL